MWKFSVCVDNDCLHCKLNIVHQFLDGVSKLAIFIIFHGLNVSENSVIIALHPKRDDKKGSISSAFAERPVPDAPIVKLSPASKIQKLIKSPLIATMIKMYTKISECSVRQPLSPRKHLIRGKSVEFFRHDIVVYRKHGKCLKFRPAFSTASCAGSTQSWQIAVFDCESREKQHMTGEGGEEGRPAPKTRAPLIWFTAFSQRNVAAKC